MTGYSRAGQELQEKDWGFYIFAAGVCAFFAAYGIGANDVANCFATSVGSKALTVKQAVVIASVCEFFGALLMGSNVANRVEINQCVGCSAMTWPRWFRRVVRNRHRHAIEQASRR